MSGTRRTKAAALAALGTAVAAVGAVTGAVAAPDAAKGSLSIEDFTGPGCTSPDGFCTRGTLKGPIKGTFTFTASGIIATVDTPTTGVAHVIGDMVLETSDGTLFCKDASVLRTTDDRRFSALCVAVGGMGAFENAEGTLSTAGSLASGEGRYEARISVP